LIVVVLLAISAGAIVLILNQDYRDKARVWMSQKTTALRGMVTGRSSAKPPATQTPKSTPAPAEEPSPISAAAAAPATQPSPEIVTSVPTPPAPPQELVARAAPETKPTTPETKPVAPAPQITIAPAPRTDPPPRSATKETASPKDASTAKVAAAPVDSATASKQAMTLWGQALDAEARRDYAKAVENYEAIQKLPKSTWPAGLEIRLALAKKHVK
jgi:outer membrane biosynthesis protein TonB